jgi:fructose-bisphosphate aldolase class II
MAEILNNAKKEHYGVAAPNVMSLASVQAIFEVADELKAPVIVDVAGCDYFEVAELAKFYERRYPKAVVAVNLDHGGPYEDIIKAIRAGFSSVMVDRSKMPFEENVREVAEIVKIAHAVGISVEAELGHVGIGMEYEATRDAGLTKKEEAAEFVARTRVDCLAVAVGTSHGTYKGTPHLEYELLAELSKLVSVPLVLHGGSGTGDDLLKKAVENGIQKVNLATDLSNAGLEAVVEYMQTPPAPGERPVNLGGLDQAGKAGYKKKLAHYVKLFDGVDKAR